MIVRGESTGGEPGSENDPVARLTTADTDNCTHSLSDCAVGETENNAYVRAL